MPREVTDRGNKPPGGCNMGGSFHKDAFASYVYPKNPGITGDPRTERVEARTLTHSGEKAAAAQLHFAMKENHAPSKLRRLFDAENDRKAVAQPSMMQRALANHAASAPDLHAAAAQPSASMTFGPEPEVDSNSAASSGAPAMGAVTRWYPAPTHARGTLRVNNARAFDWGYDIDSLPTRNCPFWQAEHHRFGKVASHPEARPRTPTKSLRWREESAWSNPANHSSLKVQHTTQRMPRDH